MKFLMVMVIIKFALVLFFLKDYPISNLDDIKNSANQVLDLSVESLNGFISCSKKSDITMPSSIDEQADFTPPTVPGFDKRSWAELFQEINKRPPK